MKIDFLILQEKSVQDDYFLKNLAEKLVHLNRKFLVLHQPVHLNKAETWFYTKRISSKFSECLLGNLPLPIDQKGLFYPKSNQIVPNKTIFYNHFKLLKALVINNLYENNFLDLSNLISTVKQELDVERLILFTQNPLSPLAAKEPLFLDNEEQVTHFLNIYPEENYTFELAKSCLPITIVNPQSLVKLYEF
jgi:hypothetical protein